MKRLTIGNLVLPAVMLVCVAGMQTMPVGQATAIASTSSVVRVTPDGVKGAATGRAAGRATEQGEAQILAAYRDRLSDQIVEATGVVDRLLADDLEGSRHQRFIVRLSSGHTILISHNIDIAPRINDLERGTEISFRGEYEWNEQGGVVHWTHHDPNGWHPDGWLLYDGAYYD